MPYIEITIESSLLGNDEDVVLLHWAEYLWTSRLRSLTYQLLYYLATSTPGPMGIYISESFSNREILDLIKAVLGLPRNKMFHLVNSYQPSEDRLCKIAIVKESDMPLGQGLSSFERYKDFNVICNYEYPITTDIDASTYEQRIELPYTSGKRDGIAIDSYTSRIFLPCSAGNSDEVIIGNNIEHQDWHGIPRFHSGMVITKSCEKSSLLSCASVHSSTCLLPGYYCIDIMYTSDNSLSQMVNLHALLEGRNFFDCQVSIADSVSPNIAVDQVCGLAIDSGFQILACFRLPTLAESFSLKLFLGPSLDEHRSSHVQIRHIRLLRIEESWGN